MRSPKFKSVQPNYRKKVLDIVMEEKGKKKSYQLPFAVLNEHKIGSSNRFTRIFIDPEIGCHGVFYTLEDGSEGSFPSDFVLYHLDPTYEWSPVNQIKKELKKKVKESKLSIRVIADVLGTSPAQVMRLLNDPKASKQLIQLFRLAELTGHTISVELKKKPAA